MPKLEQEIQLLVIEDNHGDFVLIQEYLHEEAGHPKITHTSTFSDAKDILEESDLFDVILLDLTLPDASGKSLVRNIVELSDEIPVIVLTGHENKEFGLKTLSMGVADYLLKDELTPFLLSKSISYSIERNRINRSLRQSEKQYRDLFDLSPLPKWIYDVQTLEFIDVNQHAIEHYGYSREEFLSMTIKDIRPKEEIPHLEHALESSLSDEGINKSGIHTHQKKDGTKIQVNIRSTLVNFNGQKAKMVVSNDITDRLETEKKLALSEKRFRSLVQEGSDLIAILDPEGNYKYVAPTSNAIIGIPPEEFIGTNALDYIHKNDQQRVANALESLVEKDRVELDPFRFQHSNGEWRWIESIVTNMLDNPAVNGLVANSRDVTERIKREQKLQENLELYEYVTKATDDVVYDWDITEDILYWDDSFHDKFIYDIEEGTYSIDYWAQNVHPEDLPEAQKSLADILQSSELKWEQEYRFKKQDGTYATVFERGFIIRDENEEAIRMIGSLQDITERKEYEEKLEELALVASKTTDVIFMTDPNERITWVNNAFEEVIGYQFDEVIGKSPGNIVRGPDNNQQTMMRISNAFKKQEALQTIVLNYSKTGDKYWFDLTLDPIFDSEGNCEGFIGIQKDVTDQIKHQQELRKSVERYEIVSKATSDTIWDLDLESDTIEYNQNIYGMFGYEETQVKDIADWWRNKIHPDDRQDILDQLDKAINNTDRLQLEYRFEAADGSYKYIYDRAFIVTDSDGNAIRIIGAMQDITQQREERKWLQLFESAIASTKELVAIIEGLPSNPPGREILYVNDAFSKMTGYSRKEAKGKTLHMLNGPKTNPKERQKLGQHMDKWESCDAEFINYKKSDEEFWIRISMTPVQGPENSLYWVCVGRDITERKKDEKQLRKSLKEKETLLLEIHHRVKNNLAVVAGMMQLQAFDEENIQFREKLFDSVARIQTMGSIHELLYQSESFSNLNFGDNLRKLVKNISETFQTDFELDVNFEVNSITLNINQAIPSSLIVNEVITNILKHAFEDDTQEGKITVSAREDNDTITLSIKDNGKGLPPDFDKVMNNKTLGLQLINTLAQQLGADYSYEAIEGGAKFMLSFQKADLKGIGSAHLM
ncbi:PAS domain S-box protein [Fodinibius sp. AD559]|uniref:PAS domain S-box protein n=1 Tax=Fodinibius sp. AD559 TaxID=3424179 RepID=UPI004046ED44